MKTIIGRRIGWIVVCSIVVGTVPVPPVGVSPARADWKDKLKELKKKTGEKASQAKKKWEQAKPKLRESANRARQHLERAKPKLRNAARSVRDKARTYAPRVRETVRKASESARRCAPKLKQAASKARDRWNRAKPRIEEAKRKTAQWCGRRKTVLAAKAKEAMRRYGPVVSRAIRDPENRKKAFETIGTILEVRRQIKEKQKEGTYLVIKGALSLPVRTGSGTSTLGDLAKDRLVQRFPALEGTDIVEDPAAPITALVTSDRAYFLKDMAIVKSGGEHVSVIEAIGRSSSFDTDKAIKCLELMEATESISNAVTTGEGSLDAMEKTFHLMDDLNK